VTCGSTGAHLNKEVRSGAVEHMAAPNSTSAGMCGPKLQLTWQGVDAHPAPCLDLELVCGGYPIFTMSTEAPGPTSGEAVNPQVGLIFRCPTQLS
jgi:hypothetical protein